MTISYTLKVPNSRFGGFSKLLFHWKGSTYKLLYKEFIVFVVRYTMLSLVYWQLLTEEQKCLYSKVAQYCNRSTDLIPMSFVLGFYVTLIVNQWWAQYPSIPLPDQLVQGWILWRTLIRCTNLSAVLILRSISIRVLKCFHTMDHVVEAGFMMQDERKKFESLHSDSTPAQPPCTTATAAENLQPSFLGSTFDMRTCEDAEQSQPAEASPSVPRIQTPLLSRFFTAASPTISIKNFGEGSRSHPHLRHPWADGGFPSPYPNCSEDPESVARIKEEETEDESRASKPPMPGGCLGGTWLPEASEMWKKELLMIQVKAPSSDSIGADQPEAWEA